ncbi:hypothetical protein SAMN02745229_01549 [Butyrivibrio fibrisolvens DSM 3071]|uniref:ATPase P n=1 Tax=Butyrivibrio fibrisolvens DSM 3071 TaxID=1121131 RepID=A0A1M5YKQ2_BUTFI|nr:ATPase P [Butyrivibrio fibrisolvens]SHI12637.1 hypothetical protein SAMN02745229_01549 [Butyrivibrio fibrisolvens DSM 3071]
MVISFALENKFSMEKEVLREDKKNCKKIGPVGLGSKAIYLNSFYIDRMWYLPWEEVDRVYKRIAMSAGGFTGKGVFGAMSYLVVLMKNGKEKQCLFKHEEDVDKVLAYIKQEHPQIPVYSKNAEKKLEEARASFEKKYVKNLSDESKRSIKKLENAKQYLEKKPVLTQHLSKAAGKMRVQQMVPESSRRLGIGIFILSVCTVLSGIPCVIKGTPYGMYMLLFGFAFFIFSLTGNLVPIGSNAKKKIEEDWEDSVIEIRDYIAKSPDFPLPARYAHPVVIDRMIRIIKEGKATTINEALEVEKKELKALNSDVKVSQEEYDEVVAVKPMFLVSEYK